MSLKVIVPSVGESINEVILAKCHKKNGDFVQQNELICELESDKATFELNAEKSGVIHWLAKEGDTLPIGADICVIEEKQDFNQEKNISTINNEIKNVTFEEQKFVEITIPTVGESITEVTLANWLKKDGEYVQTNDVICEIESDKATFELTAQASGKLICIAKAGETLPIGNVIGKIEISEKQSLDKNLSSESDDKFKTITSNKKVEHASPAAAKILAEKGIDPSQIEGTGKDGRITKQDALKAQSADSKVSKPSSFTLQEEPKETFGATNPNRTQRREKMSSLRKTISKRLVAVKNETAMLTTFNEVNMKPILDIRTKYKDAFKEKYGVGLGFMSFFTKACCQALMEFPAVNAYIDGEEIVYNDFCDISIAVSTPKGLVVPVIRNAEKMSFHQIESEIVRLATKARENKLSIDEMQGGTFTITNGGVFGSMLSTPIINAPQSAILGMHNIVERPVVENGQIVIRPIMYVALSYDHRIIDGRESVGFLVRVKQLLEDPARLMLGV
jgi:2-oxoglutarate dehydrogenase E2 component (dihydrolipoamide succinyltransferase)